MVRSLLSIAAILLVAPAVAVCDTPGFEGYTHLNIGARIGWNTGNGNFLWGLEASYTFQDDVVHGAVVNLDFLDEGTRLGIGYEVVPLPGVGFEAGPTFLFGDGSTDSGLHATAFIGVIGYAYDQFTFLGSASTNEVGLILKAPITIVE
jgi:hypothetical protein